MTTPKVGGLTPKVAGMTPKVSGLTPGPANFGFSPAVNINSPAAFATQRRGHLQIGSPANFPLTFTPNTAAAAEMVASMGFGQGIGRTPASFGLSLPPDENKKKELEDILRTLALKPGRISMEGVERLAKRLRLDFWQEAKETGGQTVSITGAIIVVDIDFMGNNITQVVLSFANTLGTSNDLAPQAAAILKKNLQPNKPLLISDLSDFANNLERLSKLDKISTAHSLNCFTAITGLYGSLLNIFEYEKGERAMEGGAVDAMCKGNGRPRMHCNGKVGLSVEYWRERRKMLSSGKGKERDVMMGGTGDQEVDEDAGDGKDKGRTWRIIIEIDEVGPECTSLDAVRTSEDWVGKGIAKPSDDSMFGDDDFIIDWLDPEPSVENLMEVDSARPNARFIARLDPPIIVPLLEEVTIFSSLGLYSPPGQIGATTLDGLLFPRAVVPDPPPFTTERIIHLPPGMDSQNREHSDISTATHKYTLHTLKPIYAREVWEIPFGHPRQLGPILHIFRQYVLLATLLRSCFSLDYISSGTNTTTTTNTKTKPTNSKQSNHQQQPPPFPSHINPSNPFTFDDLDSFLASTSPSQLDSITATTTTTTTAITPPPSNSGPIPIDISLSSDPPSPTLKVIFPSKITYQRIISLEIEVLRNAILTARYTVVDSPEQVARNGGVEAGMGKGGLPGEDEVMKAVENTEDVGIVVEWLRRRV